MKNIIIFFLVSFHLMGCSTVETPLKKPMQALYAEQFKDNLPINLIANKSGIAIAYSPKNTTIMPYGANPLPMLPITLLVGGMLDKKENALPEQAAQEGVIRIKQAVSNDFLTSEFYNSFNVHSKFTNKSVEVIDLAGKIIPRGLSITTTYAFDLKSEILFVSASVKLFNEDKNIDLVKSKKSGLDSLGPVYSNKFYYFSKFHEAPKISAEVIDARVSEVKNKFRDKKGRLPKPGLTANLKMQKEIKITSQDYTIPEKTRLSLNMWLSDEAAMLKQEINKAHEFIIDQVYQDYFRYKMPEANGNDMELSREDGRIVIEIGSGIVAGQIKSIPEEGLSDIQMEDFGYGSKFVFPK